MHHFVHHSRLWGLYFQAFRASNRLYLLDLHSLPLLYTQDVGGSSPSPPIQRNRLSGREASRPRLCRGLSLIVASCAAAEAIRGAAAPEGLIGRIARPQGFWWLLCARTG